MTVALGEVVSSVTAGLRLWPPVTDSRERSRGAHCCKQGSRASKHRCSNPDGVEGVTGPPSVSRAELRPQK